MPLSSTAWQVSELGIDIIGGECVGFTVFPVLTEYSRVHNNLRFESRLYFLLKKGGL